MEYYKRLDSVRGLAAILVVISHWTQSHYGRDFVYLGTVGVITFFVLSGFLITRILLSAKESNLSSEKKHWVTLKNFAIRRVLRIFPIYYLVILVGFTFSDYFRIKMDEGFWYFMTYTSNFHYYQLGGLQGRLAATWTLAIEEQFYLFFPWFVLFLRKNWTKYFLWFLFMVGVLFLAQYLKYFLKIISMNEWAPYLKALPLLTPSAFDSLGAGALLAYFTVYSKNKVKQYFHVLSLLGLASLILFSFSRLRLITFINQSTCISLISLWLIAAIVYEKRIFLIDFLLKNRLPIFLGQISYGVYLYHQLISFIFKKVTKSYSVVISNFWLEFSLKLFIVILVAYCSWRFIEKPIIKLKRYFPY